MVKPEDFIRIPVSELTNPQKPGPLMVYKDYWWAVDEQQNALFFKRSCSPQCNPNKAIVERHLSQAIKTTPVFLPWAYVKFNISDYQ